MVKNYAYEFWLGSVEEEVGLQDLAGRKLGYNPPDRANEMKEDTAQLKRYEPILLFTTYFIIKCKYDSNCMEMLKIKSKYYEDKNKY